MSQRPNCVVAALDFARSAQVWQAKRHDHATVKRTR
jgi:hypothetical protein